MLNFDNYENSLKDDPIRILSKKDLGMIPGSIETQAAMIGNVQATATG